MKILRPSGDFLPRSKMLRHLSMGPSEMLALRPVGICQPSAMVDPSKLDGVADFTGAQNLYWVRISGILGLHAD